MILHVSIVFYLTEKSLITADPLAPRVLNVIDSKLMRSTNTVFNGGALPPATRGRLFPPSSGGRGDGLGEARGDLLALGS